jgi:spectinomycin phosphotransferase
MRVALPGNILRAGGRRLLVDWDTVGLAVPERDLWWLDDRADPSAVALYRLRWDLDDVSVFVEQFRSPHARTLDTEQAWAGLLGHVERLTG